MKRLGILVCGQVRDDLVARHGEYSDMFTRLLGAADPTLVTTPYRVFAGEYPSDLADNDAYLISGSRYSVYDAEPWIRRVESFVRELYAARKPTVGICFGHQMIARALGGATERAVQGWGIGRHEYEVLRTPAWMAPAAASYGIFVSHQDQVTVLPPGAERLARNAHCENSMFVVGDCFLGIQGHPEFSGDFARDLAAGRVEVYGAETLARALPTYASDVDSALVARWILEFLRTAASTR